jgi:TRAP-type mannitol/chloroaromatic compound transport system permease large subunit
VQLVQIFNGSYPYLAMVLLSMVIMYNFPEVIYWLPNLFYGN